MLPHKWNLKIFTDLSCQFINDFIVSGNLCLESVFLKNGVSPAFTQQESAVVFQMLDQFITFHDRLFISYVYLLYQPYLFLRIPSIRHHRHAHRVFQLESPKLGCGGRSPCWLYKSPFQWVADIANLSARETAHPGTAGLGAPRGFTFRSDPGIMAPLGNGAPKPVDNNREQNSEDTVQTWNPKTESSGSPSCSSSSP